MKIVFMGTPDFAAVSLCRLLSLSLIHIYGCMLASYEKNGELGIAFPIGDGDHRAALEEALAYFRTQNRQPLFYLYSEFAHEFMKTHYDGTVLITNDEGRCV